MIKFRDNNVFLIGDTHSLMTLAYLVKQRRFEGRDLFSLGDNGIGFARRDYDILKLTNLDVYCRERNIRLFIIRGNHDAPDFFKASYCFTNLFLLPDYMEGVFPNGKTCLCVGGGISIDRYYRREGIDYWPDEITLYKKIYKKYDVLFSHDAPEEFNHSTDSLWNSPWQKLLLDDAELLEDARNQRFVISKIAAESGVKEIYHGHFHNTIQDTKNGVFCRCLDINEIIEYGAFR